MTANSWADKGSVGTVVVDEEGLDHESGLTRALRDAILHTGPEVRQGPPSVARTLRPGPRISRWTTARCR
ncbi:hypothetical protein ACFWWB_34295 [Streptomyces sp. NPDC058690]|uniref:hypothetical protein n=1 Tax=Streptomyces sp. NPDC058690 TaxID=3346600 RepID=UPI00364D9093